MSDAFTDLFVAFGKACAQVTLYGRPDCTHCRGKGYLGEYRCAFCLKEACDEARTIACKLLYIAECRGPKVFGPRPPWLKPNPDG